MEKSTYKLFKFLASIPPKDFKKLEQFLISPYFEMKPWHIQIWEQLKPHHPTFQEVEKESIWSHCFPEKPYHSSRMNEIFSDMNRKIECFLQQEYLKKSKTISNTLQLSTAQHYNLKQWAKKLVETEQKNLDSNFVLAERELTRSLYLVEEISFHPFLSKTFSKSFLIHHYNDHIDQFFLIKKLQLALTYLTRKRKYGDSPSLSFFEALMDYLKKNPPKHLIIQLYHQLVLLHQKWDAELFRKNLKLLLHNFPSLQQRQQYFMTVNFANFLYPLLRKGELNWYNELFQLYEKGVNYKLFLSSEKMTTTTFTNITNTGSALQKEQWTNEFIEQHATFLNSKERETIVGLAKARIQFHTQQYSKALDIVRNLNPKTDEHKLVRDGIYVRCLLYEHLNKTPQTRLIIDKVKAFNKLLSRKRIQKQKRENYKNMNDFISKITYLHIDRSQSPNDWFMINLQIQGHNNLMGKNWLLEIIKDKVPQ